MKNNSDKKPIDESKEDFSLVLASSIHDIKNSLSLLLGSLSTMIVEYPPVDARQAQHVSLLEYEAARINDELVQLLWLYRINQQQLRVVIEEHQIADTVAQQVARNGSLLAAKGIAVRVNISSELLWWYDAELMGGVFNNLLLNASRYCCDSLCIETHEEKGFLCIRFIDDGPGFPPDLLSNNDITPELDTLIYNPRGARLGLVFARKVLALHKSKKGQGYMTLANQNSLGGGIISLFLP